MKKLLISLLFLFVFFLNFTPHTYAQSGDEQFEATVVKIIENSQVIEDNGLKHPYQKLELIGTSGSMKGKTFEIENGKYNQIGIVEYKLGDKVVLNSARGPDGHEVLSITDYVRRGPLYLLAAIFIVLTILIGGKRGASSLFGMILTFVILFLFVLPQLSHGANPLLITGAASLVIIPLTFLLSHGANKKTLYAIIATFIVLAVTTVLASLFINHAHLTGFASEEAGFLDIEKNGSLDIKGLLFAGIIIALLGILEDITISQSAIVFQLKEANHKLSGPELFKRAMRVGRDHIASMANTLILVYAGASLPLLLLFINNPLPFSSVINSEVIAEEIVRTLVASIGLVIAVPITTAITAFFVSMRFSE